MNKLIKNLFFVTSTLIAALALSSCIDDKKVIKGDNNKVDEDGFPTEVADTNLLNTYWHKAKLSINDADDKPTPINIELPTFIGGLSYANRRFGVITNDGQAAFVITKGTSKFVTWDGIFASNPIGMAIGKVSKDTLYAKFYEFNRNKEVKLNNEVQLQINDVENITNKFTIADAETDYSKKGNFDINYLGYKFKGEANNLDSLTTGTIKQPGKRYSCTLYVDGANLDGSDTKVGEDGFTLTRNVKKILAISPNNCSYNMTFEKLHEEQGKPTQYKVNASITECNEYFTNRVKYANWLTAEDFKGLGIAYSTDKLNIFLASKTRNKAVFAQCK